jgi:prepilin-type N-terminal cleavage/methylation domain-containing protein/prepilin-type processing-associated H-X9-DG protein
VNRRAFTLIEVLVVIAIIFVIAFIALPVMTAAKKSAQQQVCLANFRNAWVASGLYLTDYDDRFMLADTNPQTNPANMNSRNDRTWVQLLMPYGATIDMFKCPGDFSVRPESEALFDEDLVPGDTITKYYQISQLSNIGYNSQYLAPILDLNEQWVAEPRLMTEIGLPADTLQYVDTVHDLHDGWPVGGGNYLVVPPCRFTATEDGVLDTFVGSLQNIVVFTPFDGWSMPVNSASVSTNFDGQWYGGAWPWHSHMVNVVYADGHGGGLSLQRLATGCSVAPNWGGLIDDRAAYIWSIH